MTIINIFNYEKFTYIFFREIFMRDTQPFFPWVGGKRTIADQIIKHILSEMDPYYEPFLGGGALYFRLKGKFRKHVLLDYQS
jgi:DNA adenine methylase